MQFYIVMPLLGYK